MKTEPPARSHSGPMIDRRSLFRGAALGAGLLASPAALAASARPGFSSGVASGEPSATSVMLWTRYKAEQDVSLEWEMAADTEFRTIVAGGDVEARAEHDFCVKPVATGLEPGRTYFYRFTAPDGSQSCMGRTMTLPVGDVARYRLGVFSCSNIGFGWFNAYAHAAEANEFDLLLHLGDYFYEYPGGTYPSAEERVAGRDAWPDAETITLADYRLRHASYRADQDLQRLTQLYPMILGWDDHESANDSWEGGAENHQPENEGDWSARKRAAKRAYREWLPVSDDDWASYEIGDLATLFRLETRLTARSEQFNIAKILAGKTDQEAMVAALAAFRDDAYRDPSRTVMGMTQEAWLADGLKASRASGKQWQVLVQQVVMGKLASASSLLDGLAGSAPDYVRRRLIASSLASKAGLPANMDAWDGYPAARERVMGSALEADANLVVLAGDTHNAWAFDLAQDGERVGVEFAVQGVTSPGLESYLGSVAPADLRRALVERNEELRWADTSQRGYMAVELTPQEASCEWRFVGNVRQRGSSLAGTHRMTSAAGSRRLA
ncbi:alkaline phosphatase [Erythrobacter sp. HKB08]|uniref:alkaline phosphatase D family protein n=1 Tax=Erythrobacter sp. HKB08 TaxID=2502843 RepID=UPI001008B593|nr:alkaline phosphatase D family protein [Erythrobacter sp. HKB08]